MKTVDTSKKAVLNVPNVMSMVRILLIPLIVFLFLDEKYEATFLVFAFSALTDVVDGYIARHFNKVTDVGKILDPVADKLTQATALILLSLNNERVWLLFGLLAAKEITMLVLGCLVIKYAKSVNSAKWYGKLSTVIIFAVVSAQLLFGDKMSHLMSNITIFIAVAFMAFSLINYTVFYVGLIRNGRKVLKETESQ